jgi:ribosomal protein L37E
MNWECNRCGHRVQPVNKEVKPDGMAWPAGSACSRCLNVAINDQENTISKELK